MSGADYEQIFEARGHLYNRAMVLFPEARLRERRLLIERLHLDGDERCCDVPAGGGFVADGLRAALEEDAPSVICIEPSARFAEALASHHELYLQPLERCGLQDGSIDAVVSLAGLHHIQDRSAVYAEWARILKTGGRLAVADVQTGTGPALFLNGFVDRHNSQGHRGWFIDEGEWERALTGAGFDRVESKLENTRWHFKNASAMAQFCHGLFGIDGASPDEVLHALNETVGIRQLSAGIELQWTLRYARAVKQ